MMILVRLTRHIHDYHTNEHTMFTNGVMVFRGNHLSSTTCLTQAFFKRDEYYSKVW